MDATFIPQSKHGIMDEKDEEGLDPLSSLFDNDSSSSSSSSSSLSSFSSSEFTEDTASSGSPSSSSSSSCKGPLFDMASLKQQLPLKRGLSKYYEGKSQSFTSFSDIRCFEDLAKPERPLKKLKCSKTYKGNLNNNRSSSSSLSQKLQQKRDYK